MATIYQVSELAGVSLATVSRVMNNNDKVSDKTRQKVKAAMDQLGYRPNSIAQSLASNRSNSIGVLVSELFGPFYGAMMSGIEAELRTAHKHAIIAAGHSEEASEIDGIEFLISKNCDALILHVEAVSDEYLLDLHKGKIPILLINRQVKGMEQNCISLNNEQGGYLATRAMLDQGHRDFAYISGPLWKTDAKDRYAGHLRALREEGLQQNSSLLYEGDFQETGGSQGLESLIKQNSPFSALVCANDEMASGAMNSARDNGINLPDQLSVVGFDNAIITRYLFPQLSTVNYPVEDMGIMAAQWVLKNIYDKDGFAITHVFEPEFVSRKSIQACS